MSRITIIKESNLLREGIINVLQDKMPEHKFLAYDSRKNDLPDLLIIDVDTDINLLEIINFHSSHNVKIAIWTSDADSDFIAELFKMGLHGYFYNGMDTSELIFAIKSMLNGRQYIHPFLSHILLDDYKRIAGRETIRPSGILTEREWDILELIVKGNKNCIIAESLYISEKTVKNHVGSVLRKLHVSDRTNAALMAVKKKWFVL
ncbi:LuxR C-terminal-related transcriptional regulator [Virgibacillus sp. L01]|uniref:LuxR C-terminal-related transcriptional regulator n=1 Tax=Virgibacillus sp. L01 TaxID=3457429 RepID=UPI003FD32949